MKRFFLAASLMIFGGISLSASSAYAGTTEVRTDVYFASAVAPGCGFLALPLPGTLEVDGANTNTLSSEVGNAVHGTVVVQCNTNFTVEAEEPVLVSTAGTDPFDGAKTATVRPAGGLVAGTLSALAGTHTIEVDMTAANANTTDAVDAGLHVFRVPVVICHD